MLSNTKENLIKEYRLSKSLYVQSESSLYIMFLQLSVLVKKQGKFYIFLSFS